MVAVKKLIEFARELHLENVAKILESAYVDDCNCRSPAQSNLAWARQGNRSGPPHPTPPHPTKNSKLAKYKGIQGYSENKSC